MRFVLSSLGRLELTRDGAPVLQRRRKELALLTYLIRRGRRPADRASVASMLWGRHGDETKAKSSLRQAIFDLRAVVGADLEAEQSTVALNPRDISFDLADFEADVAAGRFALAAERVAGPFLEGLEDLGDDQWSAWVESERAGIGIKLGTAYEALASEAERAGDIVAATRWSERHLEVLPYDQPAAARLIRLLQRVGRAGEAQAFAAVFTKRLHEDLGLELDGSAAAALAAAAEPPRAAGRSGVRALLSPDFVGRDAALAFLTSAWSAARQGHGQVVLIDGDEGAGKSRLLHEFVAGASSPAAGQLVIGRAFLAERGVDWSATRGPLTEIFSSGRGIGAAPPEALALAAAIVPELRERFPGVGTPAPDGDPVSALRRILAEIAVERPLGLVIDDAHFMDDSSRALLSDLARRPPPGFLLVLAGRDDSSVLGADPPADLGGIQRVHVGPLSLSEARALLGSMAPFAPDSLSRVAERLLAETGGNPGQLVQLAQHFAESGVIAPGPDGVWTAGTLEQNLPLVTEFRESVRGRLANLPDDARRLAEAAAVLGPLADPRALEELSGLTPSGFGEALGTLLSRRLLRASPTSEGRYELGSETTRRAVYDLTAPSVRSALHRRAAIALRRMAPDRAPEDEIARHRRLAGRRPRPLALMVIGAILVAGAALLLAQRAASARVAPGTPVLVAKVDNRTGDPAFDGSLESAVQVGLQEDGHVWVLPRARVVDALARARKAPSDTVMVDSLARDVAVRENVPIVVEIAVSRLGDIYLLTGRLVQATSGRDLRTFSSRAPSRDGVLDGLSQVVAGMRKALGASDSLGRSGIELPLVTTRSVAALKLYADGAAAWNRGDWDLSISQLERAIAIDSTFAIAHQVAARHALFQRNDRALALAHLAAAERWSSHLTDREHIVLEIDLASVRGDTKQAILLAELMASRYPTPVTLGDHGNALRRANRCPEAIPVYRRALAMGASANIWINLATCYQLVDSLEASLSAYASAQHADTTILVRDNLNQEWGRLFVRLGRQAAAESAFTRMVSRPDQANQARGLRSLGYLAMTRGRFADAIKYFDESADRFRADGVSISLVRNETLAAQASAMVGDPREARRRLGRIQLMAATVPIDPGFRLYIARTHLRIGDLPGAKRWLASLAAIAGPGSAGDLVIRNLLAAEIETASARPAAALKLFPAELPPQLSHLSPALLLDRGQAHWLLGHADSALSWWTKAATEFTWGFELQSDWERLPVDLGEAALATGDSTLARTSFAGLVHRWQSAQGQFPDLTRAAKRLGQLDGTASVRSAR